MLSGCCENSNDLDMYSDEEEQRMLDAKIAASKYMRKGWKVPAELAISLPDNHEDIYDLYMAGVPMKQIVQLTKHVLHTVEVVIMIYNKYEKQDRIVRTGSAYYRAQTSVRDARAGKEAGGGNKAQNSKNR